MDAALTILRRANEPGIAEAAAILQRGGLVAFPSETVYGLGGDARDGDAVARLFRVKGRPSFNPLIVHVRDRDHAELYGAFSDLALRLASRFWPGALTLVLPRLANAEISPLACAGLDTIALRVPAHPVAADLIRQAGIPIAAPSANLSGRVSATSAEHVAEEFRDQIDLILDGGPAHLGLESTVVGFESDAPIVLRAGAITTGQIESVAGPVRRPRINEIHSPGQLASHYAPRATLRLNALSAQSDEALLAFGPNVPLGAISTQNLSETGDLREAAVNLFAMLRLLDRCDARAIAVMPIPDSDVGEAINDRLKRAAAPRAKVR